jgi:tetratricopeptide (TPR) repeat protein
MRVKTGRNDPCPCGSGRKYKSCCGQLSCPVPEGPPVEAEARPARRPVLPVARAQIIQLETLLAAGQHQQLERLAAQLLARHPDSGTLWKILSVSRGMQGKQALEALTNAARLLPEDAAAQSNLGHALRAAGRLEEAAACYGQAVAIEPHHGTLHVDLATTLRGLGRPEAAAASYRKALETDSRRAPVHVNLGNALGDLGRFSDAAASYRRAIELEPGLVEAHSNLGSALQNLGQLDAAVASYRRALEIQPQFAPAHSNLGNALQRLGHLREAVASCRRAIAIQPDLAAAHTNLGNALRDLGDLTEALANHRRAVKLQPDFAEAHNNLGNALRDLGELDAAVAAYGRALQLAPRFALAHNNLGGALRYLGRLDEAERCFRQTLALNPDYAPAHNNIAIVLRLQGRFTQAESSCRQALQIDPQLAAALMFLAELQADKGQFAEARELFERALRIDAHSPSAWAGLCSLKKMTLADAAWLTEAQRLADQPLPPRYGAQLRYAIGKYFDDVQDYAQAFTHYRLANELTRRCTVGHDRLQVEVAVELTIRRHDQHWLRRASCESSTSVRPVFIVGMPRSGTTLAEQILASHPDVFGGGELPFWTQAAAKYEAAAAVTTCQLAEDYLQLLGKLAPAAARTVDKMPHNFRCLGLISAALPNARIIHMRRDPIDTCLSMYFQNFDFAYSYSCDLEDLAHYYDEYRRLMRHWSVTLPQQALLDVPYEGLIEDPEAWSRRMLEFIGLPWDRRCLDFHQANHTVSTRSRWQVRQKINTAAAGRWRHYEQFIGPLLRLGQPGPLN